MPKLKGLSHVVLHVRDLDKMVAFYQDVLGLVKNYEISGRMVFMTSDPKREDHELALAKGRQGDSNILAHIAWGVETVADVKAFYEKFKAQGVSIDRCVGRELYECDLALIRPDQHVAWRGDRLPENCDELLARVTGW